MMKSLYSGVAGMKTHDQRMDVIGNNVSNVNTTGYKASSVTFKDVYYQTKKYASSGDATSGGTNPTQVGYGAALGTIQQVMTQSGFTYTDSVLDCALSGEGFFQVMDDAGNIFYTRAGKFSIDSYGNLCDPNGYVVLGVSGDPTQVTTGQSQRINISVPLVDNNVASAQKTVNGYGVTVSANSYGEAGNISFTIVDSETPYATKSGSTLTIYMDLEEDFGAEAIAKLNEDYKDVIEALEDGQNVDPAKLRDFQAATKATFNIAVQAFNDALNHAIEQGGVGLDDSVVPLKVEFDQTPAYNEINAKQAMNTLQLTQPAAGTTAETYLDLDFTVDTAGEFGNKYEIDVKTKSGQLTVEAKWNGDVLNLTIPETGFSVEQLQQAILLAAGGDEKKNITVKAYEVPVQQITDPTTQTVTNVRDTRNRTEIPNTTDMTFDFGKALNVTTKNPGGDTMRLGMDGGADNFFNDMATALSTVALTNGRTAAEQGVDDLETMMIDSDGTIYGRHAVHGLLRLGRIDIATFENPTGLEQVGTSLWRASLASGEPEVKIAGTEGSGEVVENALEMSNVDLAQEFSDMIITQRGYQANSRIITVSDTMLEELVNLKR